MSIFHVFSQVASIIASFPTYCAFVAVRASLGILHNILIQLLVVHACKRDTLGQIEGKLNPKLKS